MLEIRLPWTPDVNKNRGGHLNAQTLQVKFNICTHWPEENHGRDSTWETHVFDLNSPEGWAGMLQALPQETREILPEGAALQRHTRNMLENLHQAPEGRRKNQEFHQALLTIHDAAHSRPGAELTEEQTDAIRECLRTLRMRMPTTREDSREIDRTLREAGLETIPTEHPLSITTTVRKKWTLSTSSWRPVHALDSFVALLSAKRFPAKN